MNISEHFNLMREAIAEARKAAVLMEVPVGAIVVKEKKIIGRGHNLVETTKDVTRHAEIVAMQEATKYLRDWRLNGCSLYVTLEPCSMCIGAMILARVENLYFGAYDQRQGAVGSVFDLSAHPDLPHKIKVYPEILAKDSEELLKEFFQSKRK